VILLGGGRRRQGRSADLSFIFQAARRARSLTVGGHRHQVDRPVGTGDKIEAIVRKKTSHEFAVASNPSSQEATAQRLHEARRVSSGRGKRAVEIARGCSAVHAPRATAC